MAARGRGKGEEGGGGPGLGLTLGWGGERRPVDGSGSGCLGARRGGARGREARG
jgi:hypothetical protein